LFINKNTRVADSLGQTEALQENISAMLCHKDRWG